MQTFVLPPEMQEFERDGRFLFFDPNNFRWFQTDRLGKALVDGLGQGGTEDDAAVEVARQASAPLEHARIYTEKVLRQMVDLGFLHGGSYRDSPPSLHPPGLPSTLYLHMTTRCNLRCPYCYNQDHRTTNWRETVGTGQQFRHLVDEAVELGFKQIKLTGGEPLLNPETLPLASYARSSGLYVNLMTNGTLVSKANAVKIVESTQAVSLSLDSPDAEVHDAVRGRGTHQKVLRAIALLREAGVQHLHLNAVITPANKDQVEEILHHARKIQGANRASIAAVGLTVDPEGRFGADEYAVTPEESLWIFEQQRRDRDRSLPGTALGRGSIFRCHCGAGRGVVSIDSNGDLYPCQTMHVPELRCANVFDEGLEAALASAGRLRLRDLTVDRIEECAECAMRNICGGGCRMEAYGAEGNLQARNRQRCKELFKRAEDWLWQSTRIAQDDLPDTHA